MSFLDKLRNILKVDINRFSPTFKLFSDNKNYNLVIINDKKALEGINLANLSGIQKEKVKRLFQDVEEGTLIVNEESDKLLNDVNSTITKEENLEILNFFNGKLPPEDYLILTSALVIKDEFLSGNKEAVQIYKNQLVKVYGTKANIITNLCTAGYFKDFLRPLYEEMAKAKDFSVSEFITTYNKLINDFPVAIFVNTHTKKKDVEEKIKLKIRSNKKYGVPYLNIHGIGINNIRTIKKIISNLKKELDFTDLKIQEDGPIIIVRLRFN